jgi:hypothetical protein
MKTAHQLYFCYRQIIFKPSQAIYLSNHGSQHGRVDAHWLAVLKVASQISLAFDLSISSLIFFRTESSKEISTIQLCFLL